MRKKHKVIKTSADIDTEIDILLRPNAHVLPTPSMLNTDIHVWMVNTNTNTNTNASSNTRVSNIYDILSETSGPSTANTNTNVNAPVVSNLPALPPSLILNVVSPNIHFNLSLSHFVHLYYLLSITRSSFSDNSRITVNHILSRVNNEDRSFIKSKLTIFLMDCAATGYKLTHQDLVAMNHNQVFNYIEAERISKSNNIMLALKYIIFVHQNDFYLGENEPVYFYTEPENAITTNEQLFEYLCDCSGEWMSDILATVNVKNESARKLIYKLIRSHDSNFYDDITNGITNIRWARIHKAYVIDLISTDNNR